MDQSTIDDDPTEVFDPKANSTPATDSQDYVRAIAETMHSIQAMCQQHNRHSDERLEASLKSQKEEMALMAAQFQRALQEQHVQETRELRAEIEHLKSIERSQLEPSLPPPSHPSSPQPPPVFESLCNNLNKSRLSLIR